jgi:hypothetical protein
MITARPGSNSTSIPILTEVLELPTQLATPLPVVPAELVPQHLAPEPVEPPLPEPLVMRTRGAGGPAEFSARVVDAAGLSAHSVPEAAVAAVDVAAAPAIGQLASASPLGDGPGVAAQASKTSVAAPTSSVVTPLFATSEARPAAPPAPAVDLDALADRLRAEVLADVQVHIEPALRARMAQRLEPVLRTALADISAALREELGVVVDEAVQKAMIRHVTTLD